MNNTFLMLIYNASLLLTLCFVYEFGILFLRRLKRNASVINGLLIGLIGIAIMTFHYELLPDLMIDTRSILVSVTALTFGFPPTAIAAVLMIIYRIVLGGTGVLAGIAIILVSLGLGLLARRYFRRGGTKLRWLKLYVIGLIVHTGMILSLLLIPRDLYGRVIMEIALPTAIVFPLIFVLLALMVLRQQEHTNALEYAAHAR